MKRLFIMLLLAVPCGFGLSLSAQTFTEHLQSGGTVTLTQDPRLTTIVNGLEEVVSKAEEEPNDFSMQTGRRQKVRGYRIQMFWGNSQRSDQQKANRIGTQVTSIYPELRSYTTFESPHWRCRVGDFSTREEAAEYLTKLRRISSDAMIVRSEIFIYQ